MSLLAAIASSRRRSGVTYDADAASYFAAVEAVSSIGATAKNAANAYIVGLKSASLWTLIHQLYLYAGPNTLAGALVKAKGAGTRVNGGFAGGDFSPTLGLQSSGTKYVNNGFLANSLAANSHSIFVYSSGGLAISGTPAILSGCFSGAEQSLLCLDSYVNYLSVVGRAFRSGTYTFASIPLFNSGLTTFGSIMGSRTANNSSAVYQNGAIKASNSQTVTTAFSAHNINSFCLNTSGTSQSEFSADRRQVEAFAAGLNNTQAQQLHDLTTTYVNALNY